MGLRDRLKERLKGVLVPTPKAAPAEVKAPSLPANPPPVADPPIRAKPTPVVAQPVQTVVNPPPQTKPIPVVNPPVAVMPTPAADPPAAAAPPPAVLPQSIPAKADIPTPTVEAQPVQALRFVADSADAPVRNTHIAKAREATGEGFRVHYHNSAEKFDMTIVVEPGEFLLDAVERLGAVLPYSCRNGGCLSCTAKVVSGSYEMGEQYTLEEDQIERGFFLLCCSHPTSDMELITHMADEVA